MRAFFGSLREHDRRRYAALEATKLGRGGTAYVARLLGVDPKTIRRGRRDIDGPPLSPAGRVRAPGGGRKRRLDRDPALDHEFLVVLAERTAGSPVEPGLVWTDLTARAIAGRLGEAGHPVGVHIVGQLLARHGYRRRKALRVKRLGDHPDRDAQFATIARLKAGYLAGADPVLSMDTKAREPLGDFYREGRLYAREPLRAFDHDYYDFGHGMAVPHGLYDLKHNRGHVHLAMDHDTSELAGDCLWGWWDRRGRALYPAAGSLLILCDGGGQQPGRPRAMPGASVPLRVAAAGRPAGLRGAGGALPAVRLEVQPDRAPAVPAPDACLPRGVPRRPGAHGRPDASGHHPRRAGGGGRRRRQGLPHQPGGDRGGEAGHPGRPRRGPATVELPHPAPCVISGT